ncbi:sensor histidine kinase KdpD [Microbacterium mitrae]|uniref:histidine kinase n=1 Tax=Microbacterium mitrae TaxID=664640 RepID=A0A5C8HL84_9MICO|nr:ATP-binding protein [Microbacterium mitrae]TXK03995.1 sensor histidine kinase KdpD [Microbacterium mitrae]
MKRGYLRVLLGAAPGVGKTFEMLSEGHRLAADGRDVVVGVLETHGRAATLAKAEGLELQPRRVADHRGVTLSELDVDALIARHPDVALIDELAHTNAPGSRNEKRWQDVEEIRAAGIDVITTVNVQHIESLNDVVRGITQITQTETVPDAVVRSADEIEVIDIAPQALRDRLTAGQVYPAERIDAALSNYFRLGNLTALRELALLWLADEVEQALLSYREQHEIDGTWQTRERVVVALTGGPEGETLIRRGARIAARSSGGELLVVHVSHQDGLRGSDPTALTAQRALTESLGGTFHAVVGEDVPTTLVEFAKSVNATQLVLGASRRGRLAAATSGPGIGATVIRTSGDIDVHIVNHAAAAGRRRLPRLRGALSTKRKLVGLAITLLIGPLLTFLLVQVRGTDYLTPSALAYQLLVVVVALVGGLWPAVVAAVLSGLSLDYMLIQPYNTVRISDPAHALALALYVVIAVLVSYIVDQAARRARVARRATAESELLATIAGSVLRGENAAQAIIARTREAFGATGVRLVTTIPSAQTQSPVVTQAHAGETPQGSSETEPRIIAVDGEPTPQPPLVVPVGSRAVLEIHGVTLDSTERRVLDAIVTQMEATLERQELTEQARQARERAAADHVRSALLSAVSHDVRRPLAAAVAAVGGIRAAGDRLSPSDRDELIEAANDSLSTLSHLISDLLDVSRVQSGALAVRSTMIDMADVITASIDEIGARPGAVVLALDPMVPRVFADAALLRRIVVNVLSNALRYSPADQPVTITTSSYGEHAQIRVIDHGEGVAEEKRADMFQPFQRMGDTDNTTGLGLGLALSKGFAEGMNATLTAETTPGGGLTMVLELPTQETAA